jgi:PAS domain S-box-containing protein
MPTRAEAVEGRDTAQRLAQELHDTREALRFAEERFQVLAQKGPLGILQADAEGRCIYANEMWCRLTGLSPAETLGFAWSRAVHPDDIAMVMEKWQTSVAARTPYLNEVRLIQPDGSVVYVIASALPIQDAAGTTIGFIGTVLDITARRAAEQRLHIQESYLQGLADHSESVIYLKDLAGRYLMVNRRWHELFGRDDGVVLGRTDHDLFSPPIARGFVETDAAVRTSGEPVTREELVEHGGGIHTYISQKFPVRDAAGHLVATGGISTDITQITRALVELADKERILRRLIDLQETEKRTLCHEFHDGLIQHAVGAKMMLEGWLERHPDGPDADMIMAVARTLRAGIAEGRQTIRGIRPAVLDDLGLEAAIDDLLDGIGADGLTVERRIDLSLGTVPEALQTTVYRVMQESLVNARRHSTSDRVVVELCRCDDDICLAVEDFGCGFDVATARARGCGLIGMLERVRLAGGECHIESRPGRGTRVRARLRVPPADSAGSSVVR